MTSTLVPTRGAGVAPKRDVSGGLRRFRPRLALGYQDELFRLTRQLELLPHDEGARALSDAIEAADRRLAQFESFGLTLGDLFPTLQWAAALRVLRDLHIQGWAFQTDDEGLLLKSPGTSSSADPEFEKEAVRRSFAFARNAQLAEPSATRFIRSIERRGIKALLADGPELVDRIRARGAAAIQPELELIEHGARDPATGLLLQDIWRYARHFWSIPYQSTPGRNMFYWSAMRRPRGARSSASRRSATPSWGWRSATTMRDGAPSASGRGGQRLAPASAGGSRSASST
jgi:hypothetical protein